MPFASDPTLPTGEKARHHERGLTLEEALSEPKSKTLTPHGEAHGRQM
jgi:hypothetical protein